MPGAYGVRFSTDGRGRAWGNAVVGLRNAVAPPLEIERPAGRGVGRTSPSARRTKDRPGSVHGGVSALVLDQMLGEAAGAGGKPGMTATLTLRYRRGTPLGDLARRGLDRPRSRASRPGRAARLADAEGVTVEAEGLFILPRWAREAIAEQRREPPSPRFE